MRSRLLAEALVALAFTSALAGPACSPSDTPCTCLVENNGERRTLACGDSACIGGTTVNCAEMNKSTLRGTCTAAPASSEPGTGTPMPSATAEPDQSCETLLTFCNTSCGSPASTAADCQATASSGDQDACATWQVSNGALCHP